MRNCEGKEGCWNMSHLKLNCLRSKEQKGGKHCVCTCRTKLKEVTAELRILDLPKFQAGRHWGKRWEEVEEVLRGKRREVLKLQIITSNFCV